MGCCTLLWRKTAACLLNLRMAKTPSCPLVCSGLRAITSGTVFRADDATGEKKRREMSENSNAAHNNNSKKEFATAPQTVLYNGVDGHELEPAEHSTFSSDDDAGDGERAAAFAKAARRQAQGMRARAAISHIPDSSNFWRRQNTGQETLCGAGSIHRCCCCHFRRRRHPRCRYPRPRSLNRLLPARRRHLHR